MRLRLAIVALCLLLAGCGSHYQRATPFPNEGTDPRVEGLLGELLARAVQRQSWYSSTPPVKVQEFVSADGQDRVIIYDPFFIAIWIARDDKPGHFWSLRFGARWDPYAGDGNNPKEPKHDPPGRYIYPEIIFKPDIDHYVGN